MNINIKNLNFILLNEWKTITNLIEIVHNKNISPELISFDCVFLNLINVAEVKDVYIMKIQGVKSMPDFIEVRDDIFTLISYFRIGNEAMCRRIFGEKITEDELTKIMDEMPYGQIRKIILPD